MTRAPSLEDIEQVRDFIAGLPLTNSTIFKGAEPGAMVCA